MEKDIDFSIRLLEDISDDFIFANQELLYIYYNLYMNNKNNLDYLKKVNYYKLKCESCSSYNDEIRKQIELYLQKINIGVTPISLP